MVNPLSTSERSAKIHALASHYSEYLQSWQRIAKDELEGTYWMEKRKEKEFLKEIRKVSKSDCLLPLLKARHRSILGSYGCTLVLDGDSKGWGYISRACDSSWWAFYFAQHAGTYEGATAMLLPFYFLVGQEQRSNFIGRFLLDGSEVARRYTEYSITGRFLVRLWALDNDLDLGFLGEMSSSTQEGAHNCLVSNLFEPVSEDIDAAMSSILDFHLIESSREDGELRLAYLFYLMPVELQYFIEIRRRRGIETTKVKHPLLETKLSTLPPNNTWLGEVDDPALRLFFDTIEQRNIRPTHEIDRYAIHNRIANQ